MAADSLAAHRVWALQRIQQACDHGAISAEEALTRSQKCNSAQDMNGILAASRGLPEVAQLCEEEMAAPVYNSPTVSYSASVGASAQDYKPSQPIKAPKRGFICAVFGGSSRSGNWTSPSSIAASAVFGGVKLDMTTAILSSTTTINCCSVFGTVSIIVPPGVDVEANGVSVFGAFGGTDAQFARDSRKATRPRVKVRGACVFGGVLVKVKQPKEPKPTKAKDKKQKKCPMLRRKK